MTSNKNGASVPRLKIFCAFFCVLSMLNLSLMKETKGAKLFEMKVPFASENYANRASRQLFPE